MVSTPKVPAEATDEPKWNCIVWGGYDGGNVGDELTLAVALNDLTQRYGESIAILSSNPSYTRTQFPHANILNLTIPHSRGRQILKAFWKRLPTALRHRMKPPSYILIPKARLSESQLRRLIQTTSWAKAIQNANLLYLTGGGYFTDIFDLLLIATPIAVAKFCKVPIRTAPVGIGPLDDRSAAIVAEVLRGVDLRVRDPDSLTFCQRYRLEAQLTPDDGFRLHEVLPHLHSLIQSRRSGGQAGKRRVAICAYLQHGLETNPTFWCRWWVEVLKRVAEFGLEPCGLCFHNDKSLDYSFTVRVFRAAGLSPEAVMPPTTDFRMAIENLCSCDMVVTARFHAAVVGVSLGLPTIAVYDGKYYEKKMYGAFRAAGHVPVALAIPEVPPAEAAKIIARFCHSTG